MLKKYINYFLTHIKNKFIRYVFVGVLNTIFGYSIYCIMVFIGFSYVSATLISQILGILFNFISTGNLVFENSDNHLIFKFILAYVITYIINIGTNKLIQIWLDCSQYLSGLGGILISALCSFFILNYFVFRR